MMKTETPKNPAPQHGLQKYRKAVRAEKNKAILDAAETLFARQGFYNTSIVELCRIADVSTATLYKHFQSKEQLAQEVIHRAEKESPQIADQTMISMLINNQSFVPKRLGALTTAEGVTSVVFNRVKNALKTAL